MQILVTNDDGIFAAGLRALVEVAQEFGNVTVVAPDSPRSAQGHAITLEHPLRLYEVPFMDGVQAYECSGTPVDCVKLAKHVVLKGRKFDLCLSGINHGSNASINVIYSGTMAAAMEAAMEGIPSIGCSLCDYKADADFAAAQHYLRLLIGKVIANGMQPATLLNVNIPKLPLNALKGFRICRQAAGTWTEDFKHGQDPQGRPYYWLMGKFVCTETDPFADVVALAEGYVTIVPTYHDLTQHSARATLLDLFK
jgi:5'-nucleotidase